MWEREYKTCEEDVGPKTYHPEEVLRLEGEKKRSPSFKAILLLFWNPRIILSIYILHFLYCTVPIKSQNPE